MNQLKEYFDEKFKRLDQELKLHVDKKIDEQSEYLPTYLISIIMFLMYQFFNLLIKLADKILTAVVVKATSTTPAPANRKAISISKLDNEKNFLGLPLQTKTDVINFDENLNNEQFVERFVSTYYTIMICVYKCMYMCGSY
jgi:hypothetical protein